MMQPNGFVREALRLLDEEPVLEEHLIRVRPLDRQLLLRAHRRSAAGHDTALGRDAIFEDVLADG